MGKNERAGKIELRKTGFRKPDLGYYYIVTDAVETEPNYFNGIKDNLPEDVKTRLVIKVKSSNTYDMVDTILNDISKKPIVYDPWIVFDRDQVKEFDQIIAKAEKNRINVGWSNPCIEILFLAYFGKTPNVTSSQDCIKEFEKIYSAKVNKKYKKNNRNIYNDLINYGNEKTAIDICFKKDMTYENEGVELPSKKLGVSLVYKLLEEIGEKVERVEKA